MSGANGNGAQPSPTASPNATVGSVHQRQPLGAIQPKPGPKPQTKPKQVVKKAPKRKR